ncbi:MAG: hypothetical protein LC791_07740 [Acidobacteria bacterium]|nr:hypothetical protein [Acidobacteriota bacterium]
MSLVPSYTADDITVLEGLDPVRKRPGMYIGGVGSTGLHHLVWEIFDNAIDEAMNGFASSITVTLHKDGSSVTVADDGRGIPIDVHTKSKKSALEVIFTVLHAGGKFEVGNYKTAGGLHGVGASVVNALSRELTATVRRDGHQWEMSFRQGRPMGQLKKVGVARGSGTTVFFRPDPTVFPKVEFDEALIRERLEVASYLHRGVKVIFEDERSGSKQLFQHQEGLVDYLDKITVDRATKAVHDAPFTLERENGLKLELALLWSESTDEHVRSYVNGIPTGSGGTHESGFRAGLVKAVRNYIETHDLTPKGVTIAAEDIREGLVSVLSIFIQEPQFQGQTKDRLNNPELLSAVDGLVRPALEHWMNHNQSMAEAIIARIILAARVGKSFDLGRLRYGKVIVLADADSDGHHIATLLLTFMYRHLPQLLSAGRVYLAQPPLYRIDIAKETFWALDETHKHQILKRRSGRSTPEITRFKGLGEMMPKVLWETTLNPRTRRLLRVDIADQLVTDRVINELMGKDASARFRFIMDRAEEAEELDV